MAMGRLNRPSIMVYGGTIKVWDLDFAHIQDLNIIFQLILMFIMKLVLCLTSKTLLKVLHL